MESDSRLHSDVSEQPGDGFASGSARQAAQAVDSALRRLVRGKHCTITLTCLFQHPKFEAVLKAQCLQKRGTGGVDTASTDGTFDISNSDRLGKSEVIQYEARSCNIHNKKTVYGHHPCSGGTHSNRHRRRQPARRDGEEVGSGPTHRLAAASRRVGSLSSRSNQLVCECLFPTNLNTELPKSVLVK